MKIFDFFKGQWTLKAEGVFPERIINIANQSHIFIQNVSSPDEKTILFSVSPSAARLLLSKDFGTSATLSVVKKEGAPQLFESHKNRIALFICPIILIFLLFLSTQVIWNVNIIGADEETEARLKKELYDLGVKRGVLKFTIDQSDIKNQLLMTDSALQWIWVDLKGASAVVNFSLRTKPVPVFEEDSFYNIYSTNDAVVTKILAREGFAKVFPGDTVLKGQLLIEGSRAKNAEERKFIHASGDVFGTVWEEKTHLIPKKNEIRTPTGKKMEHLSIFFSNFELKLFINSSILYSKYDMIESNRGLGILPVIFCKKIYQEVNVRYEDNDIKALTDSYISEFTNELIGASVPILHTEHTLTEKDDMYLLTIRVLCEKKISIERRMNLGENNPITNN